MITAEKFSSQIQWTLPNYNSRPLWGFRLPSMLQGVRSNPATSLWKPNVLGKPQESVSPSL